MVTSKLDGGAISEIVECRNVGESRELKKSFELKNDEKLDLDIIMEHVAKSTIGYVWIKGVVRDRAKARIRGMIRIKKGADKSDSFLKVNILLLGNEARADVRPELEIEADDVRASHAATVGRIDQEQMFYLESRGLSKKQSERVLVEGFLKM